MLVPFEFLKSSRRALPLGLFLLGLVVTPAAGDAHDPAWMMSGTWSAERDPGRDRWWINLRIASPGGEHRHETSWRLDSQSIEGLDVSAPGENPAPVDFRLRRDAGSILAHGVFRGTKGAGTFDLELDPAFPAALENRGAGRPSKAQHARLLLGGADLSFLDTLGHEKYPTPGVEMLVRMTEHGVTEAFVTGLAKAGYRLESLDALVRAVDHGVNGQFVQEMAALGFRNLDFETLMRARDHGVDGDYVQSLRDGGFEDLTLEDAIRARDHGVTVGYARRMRAKRPGASLDDVIAWRDRGVEL
jgi:hypothetical protein